MLSPPGAVAGDTHNLFTPGFYLLLADTAGVTGALRGDCPQPVLRVPFRWAGGSPHTLGAQGSRQQRSTPPGVGVCRNRASSLVVWGRTCSSRSRPAAAVFLQRDAGTGLKFGSSGVPATSWGSFQQVPCQPLFEGGCGGGFFSTGFAQQRDGRRRQSERRAAELWGTERCCGRPCAGRCGLPAEHAERARLPARRGGD